MPIGRSLALALHLPIPADPHQFGKVSRVVLIAIVHANPKGCARVASVDTNNGKINPQSCHSRLAIAAVSNGMRWT